MARPHLQHPVCLSSSASLLTHLMGLAALGSSLHSVLSRDTYIVKAHGSYFQFLTVLGLTLSLSVFILAAIADIFRSTTLYRWKNSISIVATPLEVLISSLYWGICAIDASLLVESGLEIGMLMDLALHLAPAVFLSLDFLMFSPPWTISVSGTILVNTASAFAYWYWVEICFSKNGWFVFAKVPLSFIQAAHYRSACSALYLLSWFDDDISWPAETDP
ncbi:hypothetical protein E4U21_005426 [Claviceps maximensis]|nr:hypothetical protein E4U21_005426 [Claviceps maximensis]